MEDGRVWLPSSRSGFVYLLSVFHATSMLSNIRVSQYGASFLTEAHFIYSLHHARRAHAIMLSPQEQEIRGEQLCLSHRFVE